MILHHATLFPSFLSLIGAKHHQSTNKKQTEKRRTSFHSSFTFDPTTQQPNITAQRWELETRVRVSPLLSLFIALVVCWIKGTPSHRRPLSVCRPRYGGPQGKGRFSRPRGSEGRIRIWTPTEARDGPAVPLRGPRFEGFARKMEEDEELQDSQHITCVALRCVALRWR